MYRRLLLWLIVATIPLLSACGQDSAQADTVETDAESISDVDSAVEAQEDTEVVSEAGYDADDLWGGVLNPPRELADFTLPSTTGEDFVLNEHRGEVLLFYFGYMTCPDVCPTTGAELKRAYEELGPLADRVTVVFVTVDPERDTLDRVMLYLGLFNEDFVGLRGEGDDLQALMEQFGVYAERQQVGESALSYLMDHTASIFLVGPDGRLIEQFLYGTPYTDIVHDLRVILE